MFPNAKDKPACPPKFFCHSFVACIVSLQFPTPECAIASGPMAMPPATMPETPIHKNCKTLPSKCKVGTAGEFQMAPPTSNSGRTKNYGQRLFCGLVTLGSDRRHHAGTRGSGKNVCHFYYILTKSSPRHLPKFRAHQCVRAVPGVVAIRVKMPASLALADAQ